MDIQTQWMLVIAAFALLYFLPTLVAGTRRHHQRFAILVLNLFLGWTVLGWIGALVWSATAVVRPESRYPQNP